MLDTTKKLIIKHNPSCGDIVVDVVSAKEAEKKVAEYNVYENSYVAKDITEIIKSDDLEEQVTELFTSARQFPEIHKPTERLLSIDISWGDWKHDHHFANHLMREAFGLDCMSEVINEEDGSDCYSASHYYLVA